jgi:alanyl-tRNA synthetase
MTERLYYTDSYLTSFSAAVTEVGEGGRRVYLDRTALYPTSGGQPHDTGSLNGIPVVDVIDEEHRVAHLLAVPLPLSASVTALVEWPRRFDHMQQHTGQHLLSAVFSELLAAETVGVHFGETASTVDLAVHSLSPGQLADVEDRANALVAENREVTVAFEDAATATGLRKATERRDAVRIVTIADLDRSACGGTHVRRTGEIGAIQLRRAERTKQRFRIEFLCGGRAVRRARADYAALSAIAAGFSASIDDAPGLVVQAREDVASLRSANQSLSAELAMHRARELYAAAAAASGRRVIVDAQRAGGVEAMRPLALAVAELEGAVYIGTSVDPPAVIVAASSSSGFDAGARLKAALAALGGRGGRGGGSARLAQGSVPEVAALAQVVEDLSREQ